LGEAMNFLRNKNFSQPEQGAVIILAGRIGPYGCQNTGSPEMARAHFPARNANYLTFLVNSYAANGLTIYGLYVTY